MEGPPLESNLSPRFTFEQYVVGSFNESARAVALYVATNPGQCYNPLWICSAVGQGKTHLMVAVGHEVLTRDESKRVLFVTAEEFTNEMINAIRFDKIADFHQRYYSLDVLLVDDLHFFSGKERTQKEFLRTVMSLHDRKKQTIVTSHNPSGNIPGLGEELKSFFSQGQTIEIGVPGLETKVTILKRKAQAYSVELPDEVANLVARQDDSIRELEGWLVYLLRYSSLKGVPITKALAEEALRDALPWKFRL
jgi:chromosomal replication initiator protein